MEWIPLAMKAFTGNGVDHCQFSRSPAMESITNNGIDQWFTGYRAKDGDEAGINVHMHAAEPIS